MNKQIEELALQAGLESVSDDLFYAYNDNLERFAELVAAAASEKEREACAKLVEEVGRQTAAAIRARGDKNDTNK